MKIVIDAMGGDNAPAAIVQGAIDAAKEFGIEIVLVGRGEEILGCLNEIGIDTLPKGIEIANAEDVVSMEDDPSTVVRQHKDSSMVSGLRMLADGTGDAFISAGSTGALLSAATLIVKRIHGVRRAAFAPVIPSKGGRFLLIDCGANSECTPEFLLQFGLMGSEFAKKAFKLEAPRVGLLNIGAEDTKGTQLQKDALVLLKQASDNGLINFVGNMEAREALLGGVDVLVADGFSGNVMLKSVEGTALYLMSSLKHIFMSGILTKLAALFCRKGIEELKTKMDYRETGGTALLGLRKPVIKAHGSSDARAIRSAVRQASEAVSYNCEAELTEIMEKFSKTKVNNNAEQA